MTTAQITREARPASAVDATPASDAWLIRQDGTTVAELVVAQHDGEILWVGTSEDHRDQGHATALYRQAFADLGGRIFHAPETHLFDDGARFAARIGGPQLPPCTTCCAHLYETDDLYGDRD